ncbi:hypothetical protein [Lacticaseibacillus manihotivorans]|uniref:hypothetical protein n=1 Tax=Lacticaseibacillus manihotivorans TaxID=88233 RepID=UPI0006D14088|nr:hypothetical protein [Lacticaseibacillus manihotivorans]
MLMKSLRGFQIRALTAGAQRLVFMLPNDRFRTYDVVILGVTNFARAGKYENLGWPPQTLFAAYNSVFTKSSGALGYAKPVAMRGHLMRVHLVKSPQDREFAMRNRQQLVASMLKLFKRWLASTDHPQTDDWPKVIRTLTHALQAYGNHKLTLDALLQQFQKQFTQTGQHRNHCAKTFTQQAKEIALRFDQKLDARLPITYLLVDVQNVTHFLYRDERDILFNTDAEDTAHRKAGDFNRFMFDRVELQKAEFARRGMPFYDPTWLADQRARHQPVWELSQLDAYHLGG